VDAIIIHPNYDSESLGSDMRFRFGRTMGTSRGVIFNHIRLYMRKKDQKRWMLRYDDEVEYDPKTMPDRRSGFDRRRCRRADNDRRQE
ncbi:MAG: hypothetical protein ACTSXZ_00600, partial [Alphaproteobacteria bacterium]